MPKNLMQQVKHVYRYNESVLQLCQLKIKPNDKIKESWQYKYFNITHEPTNLAVTFAAGFVQQTRHLNSGLQAFP